MANKKNTSTLSCSAYVRTALINEKSHNRQHTVKLTWKIVNFERGKQQRQHQQICDDCVRIENRRHGMRTDRIESTSLSLFYFFSLSIVCLCKYSKRLLCDVLIHTHIHISVHTQENILEAKIGAPRRNVTGKE